MESEVHSEFGDGYYVLRATKPRFSTVWKGTVGRQGSNDENSHDALQSLKRKTNYLAYGTVATGVGEVVGFTLAHFRFQRLEDKLALTTAAIQAIPAQDLFCPNCKTSIDTMLQSHCVACGTEIQWPKQIPPTLPLTPRGACGKCNWPFQTHWKFCANCGNPLYSPVSTVRFILP